MSWASFGLLTFSAIAAERDVIDLALRKSLRIVEEKSLA
jgi:hypothetical protein